MLETFRNEPIEPQQFDERLSELLDMAGIAEQLSRLEQGLARKDQDITSLQEQLATAKADMQTLRATISSTPTSPSSASKLDIPAPAKFDGKPYDVEPFLQRVENYFVATGNGGTADQRKIAFAISCMEGNSIGWWIDLHHIEQAAAAAKGEN